MIRKAIIAVALFAVSLPGVGLAKDMSKKFALGYYSGDAPVAVRYWATEKIAIDAGVGLNSTAVVDPSDSTGASTTNTFSFWVEAGVPIKVYDADRAHFFVRPGIQLGLLDDREYGSGQLDKTWTQINFQVALGAEVFFGEHFSLDATHGLTVRYTSPPSEIGDSSTEFGTFGRSATEVGFRFYF